MGGRGAGGAAGPTVTPPKNLGGAGRPPAPPALRMPRVRRDYPAGERTEEPPEGM
jgi:hypothetical protein